MLRRVFARLALVCAVGLVTLAPRVVARDPELPERLTDRQFWQLSVDSSEPNGYFRSDNLTSNELLFQRVIPDLVRRTRPGAVYLGVGPEQNFTYMSAVRPAMAIIFDIRRGNLQLQLMYKALFELAADRAEFVSMLFAKPRPKGLGRESSVTELFSAFARVATSDDLYARTLQAIDAHLTKTHGLPLPASDLDGIAYVYHAFFFNNAFAGPRGPRVTYAELMTETDGTGANRSYLATEDNFLFLKRLETKNLIVPVVGDFSGPKAIRAVAAYLKTHNATVSAFYLSNVEQYLSQDGQWQRFCGNAATLPLDTSSTFIRSTNRSGGFGPGFVSSLSVMAEETKACSP